MIGKGRRSAEVVQAIREHGAVYFITIGGAAALLAEAVKKKKHPCATRIWDRRRFAGWRWRISTLS